MDTLSYKTRFVNTANANKKWVVVDVEGMVLGRAASQIARILRGKHKTCFTPNMDCGDNVIVINADKVRLTGRKWQQKDYIHHTTYPGGQRIINAERLLHKKPTALVEEAVRGMLPKTRLGRQLFTNMRVYAGTEHPHQAQTPETITLI